MKPGKKIGILVSLGTVVAASLVWHGSADLRGTPGGVIDISGYRQEIAAALGDPKRNPVDSMFSQRAGSAGTIDTNAYRRAVAAAAAIERMTARRAPELADAEWAHMGPVNFGGRIVDLALDPDDPNTVYAAAASGGMWKSTDAGVTFSYAWDPDITQALGALTSGPDGTLYAGTGEPNPGGGSLVFGGTGLYRSTDGGDLWRYSGLRTAGAFGRIVIDPSNPKRLLAAAAGDLFEPGGERGLYLSTDGGKSWKRVLSGANATTGAVDVAIHPENPKIILAAMWDHRRFPTHRIYAGRGSAVYRSTDGGRTWQRIKDVVAAKPKDTGRIGLAFAPSNPDRAYAIIANKLDGTAFGVFRSDDAGKTWQKTAATPAELSQSRFGWWFGRVWVDPLNPNRVFVGGVELVESSDGGDSFVPQSLSVHVDQHAMVWDPNLPNRVYLGNDGGVYRSDAHGAPETWIAALRQGWTQHYSLDVSEQNPSRVVTGLQDNGCQRNYVAGDTGRADTWTSYGLCGDGLQTLINPQDDGILYGCAQYGSCSRTIEGVVPSFLGSTTSTRRGWWVPLQFDPTDPSVMYYGGNILDRSTDGGSTWKAISPDLTTNPKQLDPHAGYRIYGTITWVAAAASNPKVVYVGTDDSLVWRTEDLGKHWTRIDTGLPNLWVTKIAVDPKDADTAYVTFSGYRYGEDTAHVFKTTNGGRSWSDISGNLPNAPVNEILVVGKSLAIGTDVGVFVASARGTRWFSLGNNLPAVPVLDLRYHDGTKTLTAATFGLGIQRVDVPRLP